MRAPALVVAVPPAAVVLVSATVVLVSSTLVVVPLAAVFLPPPPPHATATRATMATAARVFRNGRLNATWVPPSGPS